MHILVFGKDGQLGKAFQKLFSQSQNLPSDITVQYVGRAECDLGNAQAISNLLEQVKPNIIINAAAYTAVDKAESEPGLANAINALAPKAMAQYAVNRGAILMHYSTDYVFDGMKSGSYVEDDLRNPLSQYGKSKAAGECAIEEVFKSNPDGRYAIFRTSWVYGDGGNFIKTMLRLAQDRELLQVVEDQWGIPTSADWLGAVSLSLVLDAQWHIRRFSSGIYHAVPQGETNWYELARLAINTAIELGVPLKLDPSLILPILAVQYAFPAPRPMNSRMSSEKLRKALEAQVDMSKLQRWDLSWTDQVRAYVQKLVQDSAI